MRLLSVFLLWGLVLACADEAPRPAARFSADDLSRARGMLALARDEVEREFYDPARLVAAGFRARCAAAEQALAGARSNDEALLIIAQPFLDIGDSHTRFYPPRRQGRVDHHWGFHAVGDAVYVSEVDAGSPAEKAGLRVGDRLHGLDGMAVKRTNRYLMQYLLYALAPRAGIRVIAQAPGQPARQLDIPGEVKVGSRVRDLRNDQDLYDLVLEGERQEERDRSRYATLPGDILVWRLREFAEDKVAAGLRKAAGARTLILDLRGNPGGEVASLEELLDGLFNESFDAYTRRLRKDTEIFRVKGKGRFPGLLLVLIDHTSASASEILARTVQMKQRGVLIGDHTAGAVSTARRFGLSLGTAQKLIAFGVGVTISDVVMADGSVIENKGVAPDLLLLPTHEQLYQGHDPVLAKALEMAGHPVTPEAAGKLLLPGP